MIRLLPSKFVPHAAAILAHAALFQIHAAAATRDDRRDRGAIPLAILRVREIQQSRPES